MPDELDQQKLVEAIRKATQEVFSTMLNMEVAAGEPFKQAAKPGPADGVVSMIGLAGDWVGTGSVWCGAEFACKISGHMLMSEFASVDQDVLDAMGEVTNMIIGNFKVAVEEYLGPLGLSIPMVIFGHNFTARSVNSADWIVVPFECEGGRVEVKICLSRQNQPNPSGGTSQAQVLV